MIAAATLFGFAILVVSALLHMFPETGAPKTFREAREKWDFGEFPTSTRQLGRGGVVAAAEDVPAGVSVLPERTPRPGPNT